ncbi:MAG: hypothetical protein DU489_07000 [Nitrosomonas sp.]|uniref:hypothetical protein n=1 Tax=Nitrosomonas sp. TaxID=42353 RepID=UPI0032EBCAC5
MTDKDNYSLKEFIEKQFEAIDKKLDNFFDGHNNLASTVQANKERITQINTKINTTIWAFSVTIPIILALITYIYTKELEQTKQDINNLLDRAVVTEISK